MMRGVASIRSMCVVGDETIAENARPRLENRDDALRLVVLAQTLELIKSDEKHQRCWEEGMAEGGKVVVDVGLFMVKLSLRVN